jgi:type I restriction enzyme R subunit
MKAETLCGSPFTEITPYGPDGLFGDTEVDHLIASLQRLRATAIAV